MRHGQMDPKASGFIEVVGNGRSYESLELVEVNVERLYAISFPTFLCSSPEVGQEQGGEKFSVFFRDLRPFGGKRHKDDRAFIQCRAKIKGHSLLPKHGAHGLVSDEPLEAVYRAPDLHFEIFRA